MIRADDICVAATQLAACGCQQRITLKSDEIVQNSQSWQATLRFIAPKSIDALPSLVDTLAEGNPCATRFWQTKHLQDLRSSHLVNKRNSTPKCSLCVQNISAVVRFPVSSETKPIPLRVAHVGIEPARLHARCPAGATRDHHISNAAPLALKTLQNKATHEHEET